MFEAILYAEFKSYEIFTRLISIPFDAHIWFTIAVIFLTLKKWSDLINRTFHHPNKLLLMHKWNIVNRDSILRGVQVILVSLACVRLWTIRIQQGRKVRKDTHIYLSVIKLRLGIFMPLGSGVSWKIDLFYTIGIFCVDKLSRRAELICLKGREVGSSEMDKLLFLHWFSVVS